MRPRTPHAAHTLTARQHDLLSCLRDGLDNQGIARRTGLSVKTVENHLTRSYRQLNVQSRIEAVHYVIQHPGVLGPAEPTALAPDGGAAPSSTRATILIVDDNFLSVDN